MKNSQHLRASIATYCGVEFFPLAPRWEDVWLDDVAHALGHVCRYNGHCLDFYSVAQHSILVSQYAEKVEPEYLTYKPIASTSPFHPGAGVPVCTPLTAAKWGLLHDAAEAYISDICAPIKPWIVNYKEMEEQLQFAIARRFDLPWPMPEVVKYADKAVFRNEADQLMPDCDWWEISPEHPDAGLTIHPVMPSAAESMFIGRFKELFGQEDYDRLARPR